jgi:hypothetical protein
MHRRLWRIGTALAVWFVAAVIADPAPVMAAPAAPARVEARSADLLAVGVVRGDRMTIHLSRLLDNAPVHDASVSVVLRGVVHPAVAETDGSYTLQSVDLSIPGSVAVEFQVREPAGLQSLKGTLQIESGAEHPEDKNSARQLGWWVLNFTVCIGFLWLISRRRRNSST